MDKNLKELKDEIIEEIQSEVNGVLTYLELMDDKILEKLDKVLAACKVNEMSILHLANKFYPDLGPNISITNNTHTIGEN